MKILIVDDEALVRKSLSRACRAKGHEVIEAVDGLEGLCKWRETSPDLVFLDVLMPGLSGPEILRELGRVSENQEQKQNQNQDGPLTHSSRAKVILMSAYSGEHNIVTAQQMGADLFIPKPFDDIFAVVAKAQELLSQPS